MKRVAFNPRISRSDWDLYDSRSGSEMREELEMLLSRRDNLSIRSKTPETMEDFKSQYFDALETLSEDEDETLEDNTVLTMIGDDEHDEDEYEDVENDDQSVQRKKKHWKKKTLDIKSQPKSVQRRIKAMKKLLFEQKKIETEMFKDIHKLEGYFYKIHQSRIYNDRLKQVEGELNQSTIFEEDEDEDNDPSEGLSHQGIPGFWIRVLLNSKNLSHIVQVNYFFFNMKFHLIFLSGC